MILQNKNDADSATFTTEDSSKKLLVIALFGLSLIFIIVATPGTLLSTQNGKYVAIDGCTNYVNYWKNWVDCPGISEISKWNSDLPSGFLRDRLRTGAALDILSIVFVLSSLGLALIGKIQATRSVRIPVVVMSIMASISLLITWGLATTILQEWSYRWGFALHVTSFVLQLLGTIAAALFI